MGRRGSELFGERHEPEPHPPGSRDEVLARVPSAGVVPVVVGEAGHDHAGGAAEVEPGEQPGQRRGRVARVVRGLDQGAVQGGDRQPSRLPLPIEFGSTTSSSQRDGLPGNDGVWCASTPTTWSARTRPSATVCTHTFVKLTATSSHGRTGIRN